LTDRTGLVPQINCACDSAEADGRTAANGYMWRCSDGPQNRPGAERLLRDGMTKQVETGGELEVRRRRLVFRAWHRGMREVDLLLGRFADAHILDLTDEEIASFESLLDFPDRDILAWVIGEAEVPKDTESPALRRIIAFHNPERDR
jgi:antitoxin CptB